MGAVPDSSSSSALLSRIQAVEVGAGAAEGELAGRLFGILAEKPAHDRCHFDLGQGDPPAVFVPRQVRLYSEASKTPIKLGMEGCAITFCCVRGWPKIVIPSR
jgi:hypothetical protein